MSKDQTREIILDLKRSVCSFFGIFFYFLVLFLEVVVFFGLFLLFFGIVLDCLVFFQIHNSIVVLDNLTQHRSNEARIRTLVNSRGAYLLT